MGLERREADPNVGQHIRSWRVHRRLSQLELAGQANISARHLSFIETGRGKASPETLLLLANTLQIPLQEQNHLLMLAGFAPRYEEAPISDNKMLHVRKVVDMILASHSPFPAFAVNPAWEVLAYNEAHNVLLAELVDPELLANRAEHNIMRLVFHPRGIRNHIANWSQLSALLLRSLQGQLLMYPGEPSLQALSEEVNAWMASDSDVQATSTPFAHDFAVPMILRLQGRDISLVTTRLKFAAPMAATVEGLTIEAFYPADPESEAHLRAHLHGKLQE